jgi:hypothetical protein
MIPIILLYISLVTQVVVYQSARCNTAEDLDLKQHRCENFRFRNINQSLSYYSFRALRIELQT